MPFDLKLNRDNLPIAIHSIYEEDNKIDQSNFIKINDIGKRYNLLTFDIKKHYHFSDRIKEIKNLRDNWDNYGGYAPNSTIVNKVEDFLESLPKKYTDLLEDDSIFPNPHGTISVEWRKSNYILSIEFGEEKSSFYSIIGDVKDSEENLSLILNSKKLINAFNKITS